MVSGSSNAEEDSATATELEAQSTANLKRELAEAQETLSAEIAQRCAFQEMVRQSAETQVSYSIGMYREVLNEWERLTAGVSEDHTSSYLHT